MATPSQLHQYCLDHGFVLADTVQKGTHMTTWLNWSLVGDVVIAVAAYEIGKRGLTAVYTWMRNLFAKSSATVTQLPTVTV